MIFRQIIIISAFLAIFPTIVAAAMKQKMIILGESPNSCLVQMGKDLAKLEISHSAFVHNIDKITFHLENHGDIVLHLDRRCELTIENPPKNSQFLVSPYDLFKTGHKTYATPEEKEEHIKNLNKLCKYSR